MRKLAAALAIFAALTSSAVAAEGPFMVRVRGLYLLSADKSDAFDASGVRVPSDAISVESKFVPEVDISYYFLPSVPNLSAELILTYPQKHTVKLDVNGTKTALGDITELPPTLTAQWHFLPGALANPYLGAGVNFTLITGQSFNGDGLEVTKTSVGFAAQAGVDVKVANQIYVNADLKYILPLGVDVKVKATGQKLTSVNLNPWLFGVGVGYRF